MTASRLPRAPDSPADAFSAASARQPNEPNKLNEPNELDWRRIRRSLQRRARYRYVKPVVQAEQDGYRISSPCCSRNIDPAGGTIDIARLDYDAHAGRWRLYSKDDATGRWDLQRQGRLHDLLAVLNQDPQRVFWR